MESTPPDRPPTASDFERVELELHGHEIDQLGDTIREILSDRLGDFEHLCVNFMADDSRLTIDEDSFEIQDVSFDSHKGWTAACSFTVSAYWGCKDMDVVADERECSIPFLVDFARQTISLKVKRRIERDTFEEF